ncbi:hypothetical protein ACC758_38170, partial [Rhizobium ruizarguesonis]
QIPAMFPRTSSSRTAWARRNQPIALTDVASASHIQDQAGAVRPLCYYADFIRLMIVKWQQMQAENKDMKRKVPSGEWDSGRNDKSPS